MYHLRGWQTVWDVSKRWETVIRATYIVLLGVVKDFANVVAGNDARLYKID